MLSFLSGARMVDGIPRGTRDGRSHVEGVPDELAIEIDADGSPVRFPAADWFICFVPGTAETMVAPICERLLSCTSFAMRRGRRRLLDSGRAVVDPNAHQRRDAG